MNIFDTKANSEGFFSRYGRLTSQKFYILRKPKVIIKQKVHQEENSLFVEEFPQESPKNKQTIDKNLFPIYQLKKTNLKNLSRSFQFQTPLRSRSLQFAKKQSFQNSETLSFSKTSKKLRESFDSKKKILNYSRVSEELEQLQYF
ncbi:unnamed protein product (macronuclear) [Paramecium tetraurelia]|uniref:Uncharacterized protein n=1 Tax=Paramecium tetraurelia TaxID=5888 RepID=A0CK05_PARTE|nr:uncharacterized protein GSPATT00000834001 [Paramecium tetraurelia]CAK71122.1 unnamed protein product [Paramecium tetraurelia]|eukprot:XP_001438519.1 hypothetical protein (macronuclear) [Paramecium tetraurelia strain d4-2]